MAKIRGTPNWGGMSATAGFYIDFYPNNLIKDLVFL